METKEELFDAKVSSEHQDGLITTEEYENSVYGDECKCYRLGFHDKGGECECDCHSE